MMEFVIVLAIAVAAVAAYVVFQVRLFRKYGIPGLPDEVKLLDGRIEDEAVRLDLTQFKFLKERFGRKIYSRSYATQDGTWHYMVEVEGDVAVAYRAVLRHKKSWFLGCTREKCSKTMEPKIILPGE